MINQLALEFDFEFVEFTLAKPFALTTPKRVAVPLLPKVKAKFDRMEKIGVISKVTTPTDWCAGMVVVPKPSEAVKICVDLTKLNQNLCGLFFA